MTDIPRSFAVQPTPVQRKKQNEGNIMSPTWTLYNSERLAQELGLPHSVVDEALRRNGFAKAVSQRMEILRWKERLRLEDQALHKELEELDQRRNQLRSRMRQVKEMLTNCRNILRMPRDPHFPGDENVE